MNEILLSIVTATFNREKLILRTYESLIKQTNKNFEWIIVDDGSTDDTEKKVLEWIESKIISIKYIKKENSGKHKSLNRAIPLASGQLTLILDSDDLLEQNAVERISFFYDKYYDYPNLGGFTFLKGDLSRKVIGNSYKENEKVRNIFEVLNQKIKGDKIEVIYTSIMKEYSFPEIENEKFIGESIIWIPIGMKYKIVYINEILYLCEYQSQGLTNLGRKLRINNPIGGMLHAEKYFNKQFKLKLRIKNYLLYNTYLLFSKKKKLDYKKYTRSKFNILQIITIIPSVVLYLFWLKYDKEVIQ
ncbi:Glycosyltransferase [Alteracholeplasma palmae J233]|uniref:Glycosyltransferase n=1 Tax=Alteracholeplasma palmae (strain ATCC 49389 / J233) TaxID=1318466 RepID=U4KLA8_ALTPJ|nr:glycosyltransferase family 2 protein [Alteracholeplasma palmae]CCV64694.1 Glycosyltransferase [Alteracholeplasma palmae J233]